MKKIIALLLAAMMLLCCVSAFAEEAAVEAAVEAVEEAAAEVAEEAAEEAGFDEFPIGPEEENERILQNDVISLAVATVYFQAVDMQPAGKAKSLEESNLHIEADITCMDNKLGFNKGEWISALVIDYVIKDADGKVVDEGSFMKMNASDGPHYGANIYLENAGTYSLTLSIMPAEDHLLHVDEETGVPGRWWTEPLVETWDNWDYQPLSL